MFNCFSPNRSVLFAVILLGMFTLSLCAQQIYFISPNGSDGASGTKQNPWFSINHAVRHTQPGDTIYMLGGTYQYNEVWIQPGQGGTNGLYKTLMAYPGETVVMNTQITVNCEYMRIVGLHFNLPENIRVVGWDAPSNHVHLLDNHFSGRQPRYGAIEFRGNYGIIEGNRIDINGNEGESQDHGIYVTSGEYNTVRNNYVSGTFGYGIHIYDERKDGDDPNEYKYIRNLVVENNFVKGSRLRSGMIVDRRDNVRIENVTIRNNIFVRNNHVGLLIRKVDGTVTVFNNTFYNNGLQQLNLGEGSNTPVIVFADVRNNIFYHDNQHYCQSHCDWFEKMLVQVSPGVQSLQLSHNLYYTEIEIDGAEDDFPILGDPLFQNPATGNFSLNANSPAIDAGVNVGLPFVSFAPDIGALEYTGENLNEGEAADAFSLEQNHPNPFNQATVINFQTKIPGWVKVEVFDTSGKVIKTLVNSHKPIGYYSVDWDGYNESGQTVASGVYYYQLVFRGDGQKAVLHEEKKMVLLR